MKIGPFRVPFTAAEPVTTRAATRPRGASGTQNLKGNLVSSEYNPQLRGEAGLRIYDEMVRSDASVQEAVGHITAPIKNARWSIVAPEDPSDEEIEQAEFVRCALFEWMYQPWLEFLDEALDFIVNGHAVFEVVDMVVEKSLSVPTFEEDQPGSMDPSTGAVDPRWAPTPAGGRPGDSVTPPPTTEPKELPPRQFVTWRRFAPRLPLTITEWHVDEYEELVAITQQVFKQDQGYIEARIPADRLFVMTHRKRGAEWTGLSMLRSAYKPWYLKATIERVAGIAYERHGVGIPTAYLPRDKEADEELAEEIEQLLLNVRAGEYAYLLFPGPKAQGNQPGFTFEIVSPSTGIPDFTPILEYFRGEIKAAVLARFSELGHTGQGARATANVQAEVWYNALHAVARFVEDSMDEPIKKLVDMNYEGVTRYPRLHASGIESRNLLEFAQSVSLLSNARVLYPDTPTRRWVRETIDAPKENPEEAEIQQMMEIESFNMEQKMNEEQMRLMSEDPKTQAKPRAANSSTSTSTKPD